MNWNIISLRHYISLGFILLTLSLSAQKQKLSDDDLRVLKGQAQQMVGFFEYQQNILGDPDATLREKQIVINESYKKSFADSLVQIEDDLDPNRQFAIFKDIQDYLKDIDFFFKKAEFAYDIIEMKYGYNQYDVLYFTVLTQRKITATDLKNNVVENFQNRYFELNYNDSLQGLKIVSIYTNSPEDKTNWQSWWGNLPLVWKAFFKDKYNFGDSLNAGDIKQLDNLTQLDISGRSDISDLNPITEFKALKQLNLKASGINDLMPLRYLKNLQSLDISNTAVTAIDALKYSSALKVLNLSNSKVSSLDVLDNLQRVEELYLSNTPLTDLSLLANYKNIKILNLAGLKLAKFDFLQDMPNLVDLTLDSANFANTAFLYNHPHLEKLSMNKTAIQNFTYLTDVDKLSEIYFEYTQIEKLDGLEKLKALKKIYCDYSKVSRAEALKLSQKRPDIVIVFESQELAQWWNSLDVNWKNYFNRLYKLPAKPATEDLHQVIKQTGISIKNNKNLNDLSALAIFSDLKELEISNGKLSNVQALKDLTELEKVSITASELSTVEVLQYLKKLKYVDISQNPVKDLSPLDSCPALEEIHAEKCQLTGLPELKNAKNFRSFYADGNNIDDAAVQKFYATHSSALVVYKTAYLQTWWNALDMNWKKYFIRQFNLSAQANTEELHKLIRTEEISLRGIQIENLSPLNEFLRLQTLVLVELNLQTLVSVSGFKSLENLSIVRLSVHDITPIYQLPNLKQLSLNETAVRKIQYDSLTQLEFLDISENKIRGIGGLKNLKNLQELNISNTRIWNIGVVKDLSKLKEFKAYNSSVPYFMIKKLKAAKPDLRITWY